MNDCSTTAWYTPDVIRLRIVFTNGSDYPVVLNRVDREIDHIEVDDVKLKPSAPLESLIRDMWYLGTHDVEGFGSISAQSIKQRMEELGIGVHHG